MYLTPRSQFASLWGGSTLPEFRGRGLYSALLEARITEARQHGIRFLTIDAMAMSRPIAARFGFQVLTHATGCVRHK
jgi:GNAT superfamily N-acetyltransferase